ncbi:MAG TPA: hypothetical protein VM077_05360 [Candidatus Limnocylindrales bacterium]|nr:hypothetical protein [Candidatus Limnocylindrales bacterium]
MDNHTPPTQTTQPATPRNPEYDTPKNFPTPSHPIGRLPKWLAALILIIIAVSIIFNILHFSNNSKSNQQTAVSQKSQPSPTPASNAATADPTASWKTYTNTKYGFSFKYHDKYTFEKEDDEKATFSGKYVDQVIPSELTLYFQPVTNLPSLKNCSVAPFNPTIKSSCINGEVETFTVNGVQFRKAQVSTGTSTSQASNSYIVQTTNKPYIELFRNVIGGGYEQSIDQILSTFNFTDQTTDTAGWKTHTNEKYGYSIKYPSENYVRVYCIGANTQPDDNVSFSLWDKQIYNVTKDPTNTCPLDGHSLLVSKIELEEHRRYPFKTETENLLIDGEKAIKKTDMFDGDCGAYYQCKPWQISISLTHKNQNFYIYFYDKENEDMFDQILQTLKFAK